MEEAGREGDNSQSSDRPLPTIQPNVKVEIEQVNQPKRSIIKRPGYGTSGRHIPLLANHFKISIGNPDEIFYQYNV